MGDQVQLGGREINIKLTISFLLPAVFMSLLAACGGGNQIADTLTPEAKVAVKAIAELTPPKEPSKPQLTKSPTREPSPIKAPATATTKGTELAASPTEGPPTANPSHTHPSATHSYPDTDAPSGATHGYADTSTCYANTHFGDTGYRRSG